MSATRRATWSNGPMTEGRTGWRPPDLLRPAVAWVAITAVVAQVQQLAAPHGPAIATSWWRLWGRSFDHLAAGRVGYDSGLYLYVARHGYQLGRADEAGFPGYALAIRWVAAATGWSHETAAIAIAGAAGLAVALVCWRWLDAVGLRGRERWVAQLVVLLFPYSFLLYGVAYTDALLLALVLGAALGAERGHWVLSGVLGAGATFVRPNGLPVVVLLVGLALERSGTLSFAGRRPRWAPGHLRAAHAGVLLAIAGVGAYSLWLWHHAGNPMYFAWVQQHRYGHSPLWHPWTWLKFPVWRPVTTDLDRLHEAASLALLCGALASVPAAARRLGASYAAYLLLVIAVAWSGTYNFAPFGRYVLPAVPVLAATWAPPLASRRGLAIGALAASGATMVALAAGFAGAFELNW